MDVQAVFPTQPRLETERLLLRGLTLEDIPDIFEYASDPQVAEYTSWAAHRTLEDSEAFVRWAIESSANPDANGWTWGITFKQTGKLIGTIGIGWVARHYRAEIGYAIGKPYWNQGLVTEAAYTLIKLGFERMGLNRIEARCNPENIGSARVMEKIGMRFEGILREQVYFKEKFEDLKMYSILRREYEARPDLATVS